MDSIKYIYFDDEEPNVVESFVRTITDISDTLTIIHKSPKPWKEQIDFIKSESFDGLILDLRLDQKTMWEVEGAKDQTARYRAEELAQKLRVMGTENEIADVPIILWSTDERIKDSGFERDSTPKDLFDLKIVKTNIINEANLYSRQITSLAKGYKAIAQIGLGKSFFYYMGFKEEPNFIDSRLFVHLDIEERPPIHDIAKFLLRKVIKSSGVLINKKILAARLGIDIEKSLDFPNLLKKLNDFRYKGVFSDGWETWYSFLIEEWWSNTFQNQKNIRKLKASEKVSLIKTHFGLRNIHSIIPNEYNKTEKFWTICVATKKPITLQGGLLINQPNKLPWQDQRYISFEAIKKRLNKGKFTISPLDRDRLEKFKSSES